MENRTLIKPKLLNFLLDPAEGFLDNEPEVTKCSPSQNAIKQILTPQNLEMKRFEILNRINNNPKAEQDFRRTCALYEEQNSPKPKGNRDSQTTHTLNKNKNSLPNSKLETAYKEYVKAYHKVTSLYRVAHHGTIASAFLEIFSTEEEGYSFNQLKIPRYLEYKTCVAALSNGELFWYGSYIPQISMFIIDSEYKFRELPWDGLHCSSNIYFNRNIYCFGGRNNQNQDSKLFMRFDLDKNRWFKLSPMPQSDVRCNSAIVNRNILIAGEYSKNILLYSIDIDSFSTISYEFAQRKLKILINAGRLYLIECGNGFIY